MKVTWMSVGEGCSSAGGLEALFSLPASSFNCFLLPLTCVVRDWGAVQLVAVSWLLALLAWALDPVSSAGDCSSSAESDSVDRLRPEAQSWASGSSPSPCSAVRSVSATTLDAICGGFWIPLLWIWFLEALAARCPWACGKTRWGSWSQSSIPWRWRCGWGGGGSSRGRWKGAMMPYRKAPCKLKYMNACRWVTLSIRHLSTAQAHPSFKCTTASHQCQEHQRRENNNLPCDW